MAIHTALQVFRPQPTVLGQGGLYRYRYVVYAFVAIVPPGLAALAFTSDHGAYMSQGPGCSLPVRPIWHRLAISWIPRYIILLTIMALYMAIYIHAEHQFTDSRIFRGRLTYSVRRVSVAVAGTLPHEINRHKSLKSYSAPAPTPARTGRNSPRLTHDNDLEEPLQITSESTPSSISIRHGSAATGAPLIKWANRDEKTIHRQHISDRAEAVDGEASGDTGAPRGFRSSSASMQRTQDRMSSAMVSQIVGEEMQKKRNAIRRQLRLLFVYPLIYFIVWLMPFVQNMLNFRSSFAMRPIFPVMLLAYASVSIMGAIDFLVFNLRERPWRHIPGRDGTVKGSLKFWAHVSDWSVRDSTVESAAGSPRSQSLSRTWDPLHQMMSSMAFPSDDPPALNEAKDTNYMHGGPSQGIFGQDLRQNAVQQINRIATWDFGGGHSNLHQTLTEDSQQVLPEGGLNVNEKHRDESLGQEATDEEAEA